MTRHDWRSLSTDGKFAVCRVCDVSGVFDGHRVAFLSWDARKRGVSAGSEEDCDACVVASVFRS